jgi:hypothetical protein
MMPWSQWRRVGLLLGVCVLILLTPTVIAQEPTCESIRDYNVRHITQRYDDCKGSIFDYMVPRGFCETVYTSEMAWEVITYNMCVLLDQ